MIEGGRESKKPKRITFGGTGYRLGETENDTEGIVHQAKCTRSETLNKVLKLFHGLLQTG